MILKNYLLEDEDYIITRYKNLLKKQGINTVYDLLMEFPTKYEDYTLSNIEEAEVDVNMVLEGTIVSKVTVNYLKTKLKGVPLTEKLQNPLLLIKYLKEALTIFHNVDITKLVNILPNNGTTLIHGDFCLPNILVHNNKISGFIDVEAAAIDDPWIDYSWAIWSLEYNLGTNKYTPLLLKELNIEFNQEKYDKYTKM